jgi:monothiol glutaredoxin
MRGLTLCNPQARPAERTESVPDGGCQTVKEGEISMPVMERIQAEVDGHPIVLFMKGTPQFPMCGFSSRAMQALREAGAEHLYTINVLEEPEIRANLPRFSNWPTFPQLFINGELIGGCDITLELHESGELQRIVTEAFAP